MPRKLFSRAKGPESERVQLVHACLLGFIGVKVVCVCVWKKELAQH
jgi:hypothetical protein